MASRRDRAWFCALAVSCVEFMRGLGEIVRRALLNLKRAAAAKKRHSSCEAKALGGCRTEMPRLSQN